MVFERPEGELTDAARRILNVLQEAGEWQGRSDLARLLGKAKFVPYDVQLLEGLVTAGLVERRKASKPGFIPFEWQYRAKA